LITIARQLPSLTVMTLNLEVSCEVQTGEALVLSGADCVLGQWDVSRGLRLGLQQGSQSTWVCTLPIPTSDSEFRLVALNVQTGEARQEPLDATRSWPSQGLGEGCTLRTTWGETRLVVQASAAQIEAAAKATRNLDDRRGSALQDNVDNKGDNAYYYAHNRKFEVPENAKVITGPGLITGGQPVLIETGAKKVDPEVEERVEWLKDYSWADSGNKVKVYVPVPEGVLPLEGADSLVETNYQATQVVLTIKSKPQQRLKIEKLNAELKVDACSTRVEAHKNRVVLQLAKKRDTSWYSLTKK